MSVSYSSVLEPLVDLVDMQVCNGDPSREACESKVEEAIYESARRLGFAYVRCSRWIRGAQGNYSYSSYVSNIPQSWHEFYNSNRVYDVDPVVRFTFEMEKSHALTYLTRSEIVAWAQANPLGSSRNERDHYSEQVDALFREAENHGLHSALYIWHGGLSKQFTMSLSSSEKDTTDELSPAEIRAAMAMLVLLEQLLGCVQTCSSCGASISSYKSDHIKLTDSENKVLEIFHVERTFSLDDVANRYGSTRDTIQFHLRNIRRKFEQPGASGHMLAQFAEAHRLL